MKVLIACEESQEVCKAFRERGHEAYSCDIQRCSGGHPEWHIKGDCIPLIDGNCHFITEGGQWEIIDGKWDLIIAHPPCTYLTCSGERWFNTEKYGKDAEKRWRDRLEGAVFFMRFVAADCKRIAIENPVGVMGTAFRKADQIIQPYEYGHPDRKSTCLWLKNLPLLQPTEIVKPNIKTYKCKSGKTVTFSADYGFGFGEENKRRRSKTYPGIAKAMAEQWGTL
ncbi:MAG: DNA cytosine methyltransferase [Clostridia bacterium]|nr:DNA cytosine methyltransferase [Clostridia bacterium]